MQRSPYFCAIRFAYGLSGKIKAVIKPILLGTSACHLCEQAEELLQQLDIAYKKIDIAEQEQWQECYAIKIPVLLNVEDKKELCWPFTIADIQTLLTEL